jgi:uncharacterized damage-inducible protein DinB
MTRFFVTVCAFALALTMAATTSEAQTTTPTAPANPITDSIKAQFNIVKNYITKAAAMLEEKDYGFKPAGVVPEVRTYGQLLGHIANAQFMLCRGAAGTAAGGERGPGGVNYERLTTKAELQKALADSFAACESAFASVTDQNASEAVRGLPIGPTTRIGALAFNVAHSFEHYGNIVTYLRAKGLVPPSSQR